MENGGHGKGEKAAQDLFLVSDVSIKNIMIVLPDHHCVRSHVPLFISSKS